MRELPNNRVMKFICLSGFLLISAGILLAQDGPASGVPESLGSIFSTDSAVEPLATSTASLAFQYVVAHFPFGGGFNTQVMFANSGTKAATVQVNFMNQAGATTTVPLEGQGLQSSQSFTIQPNDVQGLSGDPSKRNSQSLDVAWATVGASAPLNVFSLFDYGPNPPNISGAVGAQSTVAAKSFRLPIIERNEGAGNPNNYEVGLAIANPNNSATTVTVKVLNANGSTKGSFQETLAAKNQAIFTLSSKMNFDSSLFSGSMAVCASQPIGLVTIGFEGGQAFFTTSVTNDPCP
jgi:hypothetical protein